MGMTFGSLLKISFLSSLLFTSNVALSAVITPQAHAAKAMMVEIIRDNKELQFLEGDIDLVWHDYLGSEAAATKNGGRWELHMGANFYRDYSSNKSWIALVVAHELAHMSHGDVSFFPRMAECFKYPKRCEKQADLKGMQYANKAGFDGCAGPSMWEYYILMHGDKGGPDHPDPSERMEYMRCR